MHCTQFTARNNGSFGAWHGKYIMQIIADANLVNYFHGGPSGPKNLFTGKKSLLIHEV